MQKAVRDIVTFVAAGLACASAWATEPNTDELSAARQWAEVMLGGKPAVAESPGLYVLANHDPVQKNGRFGKPMKFGGVEYTRGLYCHARSELLVRLPEAAERFEAVIGVDDNENTSGGAGSVVFTVHAEEKEIFRSEVLRGAQAGVPVDVALNGVREFSLIIEDGGDGISSDQADWADAKVTLAKNEVVWLNDLPMPRSPVILEPGKAPFSFVYGGIPSRSLLPGWKTKRTAEPIDADRMRITTTYLQPEGGMEVRCEAVYYTDFPSVEWTLYFKNNSRQDSFILEDIQPLDIRMERSDRNEFMLHHFVGSPCQPNDYEPLCSRLEANTTKHVSGARGRATSSDMCYFNVESTCADGLIVAIGWPGQWAADFQHDAGKSLAIRAGQERTHFKLLPGEEVRTPLVALQFWHGDWVHAQNVWRRWMVAHNLPKPGGRAIAPFVTADSSAQFGEMIGASEESQCYFIDRYVEEHLGIEYWWMDAGWYICDGSWPKTGTWEVDKNRFPHGLRAITDHGRDKGMKTIVWFEPERVAAGTWLTERHPNWIIGGQQGGLLYLGNPEALEWLIGHVDALLRDEGIDLYRQDFNFDPLDSWHANDAVEGPDGDRQGISEIKHITGLFAYWDELVRRRHGDLLIDTCASGGRRNDLETLRRAVPLWRSDFPFEPTATQCHSYGISFWIPLSGTGVKVTDDYDFRSNAAPEFTCHWDVRDTSLDYDRLRNQLRQWREYAPNFMGDYYPLTSYTTSKDAWMAWQFHQPENGKGMVQAFRRPECVYPTASLLLRGLEPAASYRITDIDTASVQTLSGKALMEEGLAVTVTKRPGAAVLLYERQ